MNIHGLAIARGATASWTGSTCTTYCHGTSLMNGTHMQPSWTGGATEVFCGSCHGLPPVNGIHPAATPATCVTCHGSVVDGSLNFTNKSLHLNGVVNFN